MLDDDISKCIIFDEISEGNEVNCFGDSLTFGWGGNGLTYPVILQTLLGNEYKVNNLGIGGETTITIAGRQGSIPMRVKAVNIPADVKTVEIEFLSEDCEVPKPLRQGEAGMNPCYLNGTKGELSITQSTTTSEDAKWYFTREEVESDIHIKDGEELITQASLVRRKGILVLWSGTNDCFYNPEDKPVDRLIENQKKMINYLKVSEKKYIVIGLTHKKGIEFTEMERINKELEKAHGIHFLDIRKCLLENGLSVSGLQPTEQDILDIYQGNIPESLRVDDVHLNAYGYTIIGQQVYQKGLELGYW